MAHAIRPPRPERRALHDGRPGRRLPPRRQGGAILYLLPIIGDPRNCFLLRPDSVDGRGALWIGAQTGKANGRSAPRRCAPRAGHGALCERVDGAGIERTRAGRPRRLKRTRSRGSGESTRRQTTIHRNPWNGAVRAVAGQCLTTRTGRLDLWTTVSATDPVNRCRSPLDSCDPITTPATSSSSSSLRISGTV